MAEKEKKQEVRSLVDIVGDIGDLTSFVQNDEFNMVVNQEPPAHIVKDHPTAKGVKYIPIDKIEMMLTKIFQQWYVEIHDTKVMLNAVAVQVRLYYLHPLTKKWVHHDGVGATAIQTNAGKTAADLANIKSNAIMLALPAAESYAVKDAAEKIGKVFGRDLNRKDTMAFTAVYAQEGEADIEKQITEAKTISQLQEIFDGLTPEGKAEYQELIEQRFGEVEDDKSQQ